MNKCIRCDGRGVVAVPCQGHEHYPGCCEGLCPQCTHYWWVIIYRNTPVAINWIPARLDEIVAGPWSDGRDAVKAADEAFRTWMAGPLLECGHRWGGPCPCPCEALLP